MIKNTVPKLETRISTVDKNLINSVISGDKAKVVNLVNNFAGNVNIKDNWGEPLIFIAFDHNRLEIARFLLEKGVDVNQKNFNNITPIQLACEKCAIPFIKLFLEFKAKTNVNDGFARNIMQSILYGSDSDTNIKIEAIKCLVFNAEYLTLELANDFYKYAVENNNFSLIEAIGGRFDLRALSMISDSNDESFPCAILRSNEESLDKGLVTTLGKDVNDSGIGGE